MKRLLPVLMIFSLVCLINPNLAKAQTNSGWFKPAVFISSESDPNSSGTSAHSIAVGDVNNDGRDDVLIVNYGQLIFVWLQTVDGKLARLTTYDIQGFGTSVGSLGVGDLNGDGLNDVLYAG